MNITIIVLGLVAGGLSGLLGIGGGIIIVPALVYFFHFSQRMAQGTTLAMLSIPVTFLAAFEYYRQGNTSIKSALLLCIGFVVGSFLSARFIPYISEPLLKRLFGFFLLIVSIKMLIKP